MVKVNLGGCSSFVKDADYKAYVEKALDALEVLAICYNAIGDVQNAEKYLKKSIQNGSNEAKLRRVMYAYKMQNTNVSQDDGDDADEYVEEDFDDENEE